MSCTSKDWRTASSHTEQGLCHIDMSDIRSRSWSMRSFTCLFLLSISCSRIPILNSCVTSKEYVTISCHMSSYFQIAWMLYNYNFRDTLDSLLWLQWLLKGLIGFMPLQPLRVGKMPLQKVKLEICHYNFLIPLCMPFSSLREKPFNAYLYFSTYLAHVSIILVKGGGARSNTTSCAFHRLWDTDWVQLYKHVWGPC
jgi:hypothetical protein